MDKINKRVIFELKNFNEVSKLATEGQGKKAILTKIEVEHILDEYCDLNYLLTELDYINQRVVKSDRYSNDDIKEYGWDKIVEWVEGDIERYEEHGIDWYSIGIVAKAIIMIPFEIISYKNGLPCKVWNFKLQEISSGGIWGIESDSDDCYVEDEGKGQIDELFKYLEILNVDVSAYKN